MCLCCRILVHSVIPPSASLQPLCSFSASLWLLCIIHAPNKVLFVLLEILTCYVLWIKEEIVCLVVTVMMPPFQQVEHHGI